MKTNDNDSNNIISLGSVVSLMGFILSGPVAFFLFRFIDPQPQLNSPAVFREDFPRRGELTKKFIC
jgi:hypothetical protein